MVTEIPISRGLVTLVDDADVATVVGMGKWYAERHRTTFYARKSLPRNGGPQRQISLHNFLTGWELVDHVNGDGLDNRRSNLRQATPAQNACNRGLSSNNTSGFKGVYRSRGGRWLAQIQFKKKLTFLGSHETREEAARAYDAAARELHGEFARLNFPDAPEEDP